jgi:hypothetical protein
MLDSGVGNSFEPSSAQKVLKLTMNWLTHLHFRSLKEVLELERETLFQKINFINKDLKQHFKVLLVKELLSLTIYP